MTQDLLFQFFRTRDSTQRAFLKKISVCCKIVPASHRAWTVDLIS